MKKLLNKYFFTISQVTILFIFALPMTNLLSKSFLLYILLFIIIIGSTFFIERLLQKVVMIKHLIYKRSVLNSNIQNNILVHITFKSLSVNVIENVDNVGVYVAKYITKEIEDMKML